MRTIFKIAKTELRDLFYSPIAWLILIIFTFQTGMAFSGMISDIVRNHTMGYGGSNITLGLFGGWDGLFVIVQSYLYLYIPLLTMGLMSRELGSGSIKLLYSSPVTNAQIILGKYLSMMIYGLVLMGVLAVYAIYGICTVENADIPVILTGMFGVYLLLCAYVAIGLFMSSLTSYQIVAAVGTLAILAVLTYVKGMWQGIEFIREITYWFGISGRSGEFMSGMICSEDVLYFIVVVALFLFMTIIRMQTRRQKMSWIVSFSKYFAVWIAAIFLAYMSSRPALMTFYDATDTKINTLTPNSQKIIEKAKGGLTVTAYVNILDKYFWIGIPERYNEDIRMFKQYTRFKPEIKMEYVLYYDTVRNDGLEKGFKGLTIEEKAKRIIELNDLNPKKVLTPEQIRKKIDLSSEGNRFVRLMERESGEKTFLRVFDDNMIFPYEPEITAALKRMVMELPTIGFLTGHGERETDRMGERSYSMFTHMKTFRHSLTNQGFDFIDVTLENELPEEINILVIAEMKQPLSEEENANLVKYIARGGNLMIIGEPKRQEVMNPLVEPFGVKFLPGYLVQQQPEHKAATSGTMKGSAAPENPVDLIITKPTKEAAELVYIYNQLRQYYVITMPTVAGLDYTTDKGFQVTPLFMTDSTSWNEMETTDIIDDIVKYNPEAGEVRKSYATGLALSRKIGDREQKIVILGDADCISDGEFSRSRPGLMAANYGIIEGSFFWMSDGEVPIDVRRPQTKDSHIMVGEEAAVVTKYALMAVFPGILLFLALFIWIRRRSR